MRRTLGLVTWLLLLDTSSACRRAPIGNVSPESSLEAEKDDDSYDDLIKTINQSQDQLTQVNGESANARQEYEELKRKIDEKNQQLADQDKLSEEQKQKLRAELDQLNKQLADLNAKNKALADKQAALEKELAQNKATVSTTTGTSGYPLCVKYYGALFDCNGKTCAKSDANYTAICEVTSSSVSAEANLYPACGAVYYGAVFDCNSKKCAKSDAGYKNICEVGADSKPAVKLY